METAAGRVVADGVPASGEVMVSVRPEQMRVVNNGSVGSAENRMTGRVVDTTFLGEASEHTLDVKGERVKVVCAPPVFNPPEEMTVEFWRGEVVVLAE